MMRWAFVAAVWGWAAVAATPAGREARVDTGGVLRWQDDGSEVALFGVNYYTPFSVDYHVLELQGLDPDVAIRQDVAHFERLGLTAIRLHCFDREISDREGNLVDNRHLELLDLLIDQCARRGIYTVLTPIAWWGVPKPGGFSDLYTMPQMTTDPQARQAQCRYLGQFMGHVNRYRQRAYKDDPAVVAVELINEPLYPSNTTDAQVTEYIDALAKAVRDSGCRKPIFYNCWADRAKAAGASTLDGVTFGWYPTGLAGGAMIRENRLLAVDDYPGMRDPALAGKATIVYEFDAADVHGSVMYPAMARAFRSGGAQIATQFQYELLCIAAGNPNWQTHYLNMLYTPGKALSFAIAAEVMRSVPRLQRFGRYPESARFGDFRLSFEDDLSEWATAQAFLYSNTTRTVPPSPATLARLAGCGSSPVVEYEGTGAYFLDRLAPGVWGLQVYPDAVVVADPYTGGANEKVRLLWGEWPLTVRLPDLGAGFQVTAVRDGRPTGAAESARAGRFPVRPGAYVLTAAGRAVPETVGGVEYVAPAPVAEAQPPAALVDVPETWREGYAMPVGVTAAVSADTTCTLYVRTGGDGPFVPVPLSRVRAYRYEAVLPVAQVVAGRLEYYLAVKAGDRAVNLPGGDTGERDLAATTALPPVELLRLQAGDPPPTAKYSGAEGKAARTRIVPGEGDGGPTLRLEADGFDAAGSCASTEWPRHDGLPPAVARYGCVRVVARGGPDTGALEISLVQSDGRAFGADIALTPDWRETVLPLERLRPMWQTPPGAPDLARFDHLTFVFGAWNLGESAAAAQAAEVRSVRLGHRVPVREVAVAGRRDPVLLTPPWTRPVRLNGHDAQTLVVPGMEAGSQALRVAVREFGPAPDCSAFRLNVPPGTALWREQLGSATVLTVKARARQAATTGIELVLVEDDGAPWGMVLPLTPEWTVHRVPIAQLRHFAHWDSPARDRGGAGDHLRPDRVQAVNVCFGAWLYGEKAGQPHAFELQEIGLAGPEGP